MEILLDKHINIMQGYLLARPSEVDNIITTMAPGAVTEMLDDHLREQETDPVELDF